MPDRETHLGFGLIFVVALYLVFQQINFKSFTIAEAFFLYVGSIIPDIIEPATSYNHRAFFHSWKLLAVLLVLSILTFLIWHFSNIGFIGWIAFFCAGYIVHLLLDSTTKMSLPSE